MDWEDVADLLRWSIIGLFFLAAVVLLLMLLVVLVSLVINDFKRGHRSGKTPVPPLSIDELLACIPEVPYQELSSGGARGGCGDDGDSCVICVEPYEAGEACSVLPGYTHMFHKPCVVKWLRQKTTCPLCRATVGVPLDKVVRFRTLRRILFSGSDHRGSVSYH